MWLLEIARRLKVPVAATVQYPTGLGPLAADLAARLDRLLTEFRFTSIRDSLEQGAIAADAAA